MMRHVTDAAQVRVRLSRSLEEYCYGASVMGSCQVLVATLAPLRLTLWPVRPVTRGAACLLHHRPAEQYSLHSAPASIDLAETQS